MSFSAGTVAYSYVRISTSKQAKGEGPERQFALSKKYAEQHGLTLDETLEDIGRSGWSGANIEKGALGRFLDMIAAGQIARGSVLLVESLDRLSRQHPLDAQVHLTAILTSGVSVVTLQDKQVYSSAGLREDWTKLIYMITIQARAHEESQRKSQLSKSAIAKRREKALRGEGRFNTVVPAWISQYKDAKGQTNYELNDHADTVRLMFELAKDGLGQMAVTKEINRRKMKPFREKNTGWHQSTISRILENPATYGEFTPTVREGSSRVSIAEPIADYFPPVITKDDFLAAQVHRKRRVNKGRKGGLFTNLFNGLCVCQQCAGTMQINYTGKAGQMKPYLVCYNHWRGNGCENNKHFMYADLENVVLDTVREFGLSDFISANGANSELKALDKQILAAQAIMAEVAQQEDNLVSQMSMVSAASANVLARRLDLLQIQKADADRELKAAQDQRTVLVGSQQSFNDIDAQIQRERAIWPAMSEEDRYRSRSKINAALKYLFTQFMFDKNQHRASLVFQNGLFAYHFHKGKLVGTTDMLSNGMITSEPGSMTLDHFTTHVGKSNPKNNTEQDWQDLETEQTLISDYMKLHKAGIMRKHPQNAENLMRIQKQIAADKRKKKGE